MNMPTVLVIDDAEEVRKIMHYHLENRYKVLEAVDGEKGLAMILDKHPDLVILDINLPKMTGLELYSKITSATGKPVVPVIVLTVRSELGKLFEGLNVDGFITKPFNVEKVLEEIDTVMEKKCYIPRRSSVKPVLGIKKILVIDDDAITLSKIAGSFIAAGYAVQSTQTVLGAIEKIMTMELPDLIAIKLGLSEISGEQICMKFKQMPKTMDIPLLLYTPPNLSFDRRAIQDVCKAINVGLIETNDPAFLLKAAQEVFSNQRRGVPQKEDEGPETPDF